MFINGNNYENKGDNNNENGNNKYIFIALFMGFFYKINTPQHVIVAIDRNIFL